MPFKKETHIFIYPTVQCVFLLLDGLLKKLIACHDALLFKCLVLMCHNSNWPNLKQFAYDPRETCNVRTLNAVPNLHVGPVLFFSKFIFFRFNFSGLLFYGQIKWY